eukprot:4544857-Prymnesium_polylepis.1
MANSLEPANVDVSDSDDSTQQRTLRWRWPLAECFTVDRLCKSAEQRAEMFFSAEEFHRNRVAYEKEVTAAKRYCCRAIDEAPRSMPSSLFPTALQQTESRERVDTDDW